MPVEAASSSSNTSELSLHAPTYTSTDAVIAPNEHLLFRKGDCNALRSAYATLFYSGPKRGAKLQTTRADAASPSSRPGAGSGRAGGDATLFPPFT
jgi:hypothetical protein